MVLSSTNPFLGLLSAVVSSASNYFLNPLERVLPRIFCMGFRRGSTQSFHSREGRCPVGFHTPDLAGSTPVPATRSVIWAP